MVGFFIFYVGLFLKQPSISFQKGDIFFQDLDCGPPCEAIEAVTQGYNGSQLSHCAIITAVGPSYQETILTEAIGDYVIETTLEEFLNRSDKVIVGRLKNDYQLATVGFSELVTSKADKEFKPFISLSGSYNSYLSGTDSKQNFQGQTSSYVTKIDKNNWMSGSIKTGFVKHTNNKESYLVIGYTRSYKEKDLYLQLGLIIDF